MFVCRAVGRSMEPRIHDGDYVVFRAKPAGTRQGRIVLSPTNPEYEPIVFSPEESGHVEVIAEMVTVLRGGL